MNKLTRVAASVGASTLLFASSVLPVLAAGTPSQQACFGQGRSEYAKANPGGVGVVLSERKGDNAEMNAAYRDACQAL